MIRVVIVDDHRLFRQGLAVMLAAKEDIEVVAKFESAVELLKQLPGLEFEILLLDIDMPELDGITAAPKILEAKPDTKIAILSMHLSGMKIQEAVAAKVKGYLLKNASDTELIQAIRDINNGKDYFAKEAQDELIASYRKKEDPTYVELTPRELDILKLVCEELNSQEIAEELCISVHTAETHRRNILSKAGCKNSIGLVKYAIENELI